MWEHEIYTKYYGRQQLMEDINSWSLWVKEGEFCENQTPLHIAGHP